MEELIWSNAKSKISTSTIKQYLNLYANGKYINYANQIFDSLIWDSVNVKGAVEDYYYYKKKFPGMANLRNKQIQ